jgi:WD40 repeat protein
MMRLLRTPLCSTFVGARVAGLSALRRKIVVLSGACLVVLAYHGMGQAAEDAAPDASGEPAAAAVSYYRQVRPLLQRHCSGCHQPAKAGGKLVMMSAAQLLTGGERGPSVVAGQPDSSVLVQVISGEKPEMPIGADPLPKAQIELIRQWISQGAQDDTPAAARDTISADHPPEYTTPPVITALAYSPDNQWLAVSGYREVVLHRLDMPSDPVRLVGRSPRINAIRFSGDGGLMAVIGGAPALFGEVQFWKPAEKVLAQSVTLSFDTLFGGSFNATNDLFAFGSFDNKVRVVQVADGKVSMSMDAHTDLVFDACFSLQQDHVISVSRDMSMKLTELKTGQFIDNITSITPGALKGGLMTVVRHPKEDQVLIGGSDGEPKLYKIFRTQARQIGDDFNKIRAYPKFEGRVVSVQFNSDGSQFVAGSSNATTGAARIYNTNDGTVAHELPQLKQGVFAVAFRPDGQQVATGGLDGTVRLYSAQTGQLEREFVPVPLSQSVADRQP